MDIKGITETSLMRYPCVAIRRPSSFRYARYLQFGRMSMAVEAMQQERPRVDKAYLLSATIFSIVHKDSVSFIVISQNEISDFFLSAPVIVIN